MGKRSGFDSFRFWSWFGLIAAALLVVGYAATTVYCFVVYGGKPAAEIPGWALWFMFGGGGH